MRRAGTILSKKKFLFFLVVWEEEEDASKFEILEHKQNPSKERKTAGNLRMRYARASYVYENFMA